MNFLITALVGLVSAVGGGIMKGYWERQVAVTKHKSESALEHQKFESDLILSALHSDDSRERVKSLEFLIKTNLIRDPQMKESLMSAIQNPDAIPQFVSGIKPLESAKDNLLEKRPELIGRDLALTGFLVRSGDLVDALTPIFSVLNPDLTLGEQIIGSGAGGSGGAVYDLQHKGYIVTGIDTHRGIYFGGAHLIQIQVYWHKLTSSGIDTNDGKVSELLGSGNFAENVTLESFRAQPGHYVSDYDISTQVHSDGTHYVGEIEIDEKKLPLIA